MSVSTRTLKLRDLSVPTAIPPTRDETRVLFPVIELGRGTGNVTEGRRKASTTENSPYSE